VTRPDHAHDFSDADRDTDADPSALRRLVMDQFLEPGGAAVRLFTTATLAEAGDDPFSSDAYARQSAQGERLVAGTEPLTGSPVVAVNYHEIADENRPAVEERLRRLRDLGPVLDPDVDATEAHGPRIVVGVYDCYRDATLFVTDLCHRLGLRAWVFPVFEVGDEPGTAGVGDAELADIAEVHELGFHTASHVRVDQVTEANVDQEVRDVVARLTELGGRPPRLGAWRGGSRWDESHLGDRVLRELGVRYVMSNWALERIDPAHP
jgi:hypothetical protein